jgi:uncharacterized membrane protein
VEARKNRLRRRLSIVAAAALVAALVPAVAAQAATTAAAGTPIKIAHSNKCLNVQGASTANSAKIVQYACSTTATNDKFKLVPKGADTYWIQGVGSGKCFNVQSNSTANSAPIIQYTCGTQANTLWWIDEVPDKPTFRLVSTSSGKCLDIKGNSTANSAALIQYTCSSGTTALNEQFYNPPTASGTATHRAFTAKQPISAVQGTAALGSTDAPFYYSYIGADNQLTLLTDLDPDPYSTNPNPPDPVLVASDNYGYTGRTYSAPLADGRVQVVSHDAAAGDVVYSDEEGQGTGDYTTLWDIGGAFAAQPYVGPVATDGRLAGYAVVGGALWYAPEVLNNTTTPYGAWRTLGGTGLTGTPVSVLTSTGVRIFALTTAGTVQTATLSGTTLSDWTDLGGTGLNGTPSAVVGGDGTVSVFVRSGDGTIVTKKQSAGGTFPANWTTVGDFAVAGSPSAVLDVYPGQIAVAVRGTDSLIYFAYETARGSGQFTAWGQVSDPENNPESVAASDPTSFNYDVASGPSFGITFQSTDDIDYPVVYTFDSAKPVAGKGAVSKTARLHPKLHKFGKLTKVGKPALLKSH